MQMDLLTDENTNKTAFIAGLKKIMHDTGALIDLQIYHRPNKDNPPWLGVRFYRHTFPIARGFQITAADCIIKPHSPVIKHPINNAEANEHICATDFCALFYDLMKKYNPVLTITNDIENYKYGRKALNAAFDGGTAEEIVGSGMFGHEVFKKCA